MQKCDKNFSQNSVTEPGSALAIAKADTIWQPDSLEKLAIVALVLGTYALTRKHSRRQIKALMRLIARYGFIVPILVDQDNAVIAGHARVLAAQKLGMSHVPIIRIRHLTDPQIRALRIADNRLPELAEWDKETLTREILELQELHINAEELGFSVGEVDLLIDRNIAKPLSNLNDCPAADRSKAAIVRLGDVWHCGPHRVACGDAREANLFAALVTSATFRMVCTDPPYNVAIENNASGLGKVKHPNFGMACGEMTDDGFITFLVDAFRPCAEAAKPGALIYIFMDGEHLEHVYAAGRKLGLEKFNLCTWAKTNAGMGSMYRSQTEYVVIFKVAGAAHVNNIELGRFGRNRTTLWRYEGASSINPKRRKELQLHPTVKNAEMIADAILDCTRPGDIVFDGFLGSGTTLIAAEDIASGERWLLDLNGCDTRQWDVFVSATAASNPAA